MGNPKRQRQKANRQQKVNQQWVVHDKRKRRQRVVGIFLLVAMIGTIVGAITLAFNDDDSAQQLDLTDDSLPEVDIDPDDDTDPDDPTDSTDGPQVTQIDTHPCPADDGSSERTTSFDGVPSTCIDRDAIYRATIETTKGTMVWELDPSVSPVTVNSFVFLARYHFYDDVPFHRIIPGFVVQGGDAVGNPPGTGGPGYRFGDIPGFGGETPEGGYEIGDVAMANSGSNPDNSGSQFFIITGDNGAALQPNFALLGQVVDGMDVALELEAAGSASGTPTEDVRIISIAIEEIGGE